MFNNRTNDIVTLEKWIAKELGPDMIQTIQKNDYINYGVMKQILDYIFKNVYSQDFSKLVKLNLEIDYDSTINEQDDEFIQLKMRDLELKRQIEECKKSIQEEKSETNRIIKDINETKKAITDDTDITNKRFNLIFMESSLNKTNLTRNKLDMVNKKLSDLLDTEVQRQNQLESIQREEFENLLHNFSKMNSNKQVDDQTLISTNQKLISKFSTKDCLKYFNQTVTDDIQNIEFYSDEQKLENERNILLYKLMANDQTIFDEIESDKTDQFNKCFRKKSVQAFFELIEKTCLTHQIENDNQDIEQKTSEYALEINNHILNSYRKDDYQLMVKLFRSHILLKRAETHYAELKKICDELQKEHEIHVRKSSIIKDNCNNLKELNKKIHLKQLKIDELIEANYEYFSIKLPAILSENKVNTDCLLELVRNMNGFVNGIRNRNDTSIMFNAERNYARNFEDFRSKFNLNQHSSKSHHNEPNEQLVSKLENFLDLNQDLFKTSNGFLFSKLLENYVRFSNELKQMNNEFSKNLYDNNQLILFIDSLNEMVERCEQADKALIDSYHKKLVSVTDQTKVEKSKLNQFESLVDTWARQPGAYECLFENITVNEKTLQYYYKVIDETVAQYIK